MCLPCSVSPPIIYWRPLACNLKPTCGPFSMCDWVRPAWQRQPVGFSRRGAPPPSNVLPDLTTIRPERNPSCIFRAAGSRGFSGPLLQHAAPRPSYTARASSPCETSDGSLPPGEACHRSEEIPSVAPWGVESKEHRLLPTARSIPIRARRCAIVPRLPDNLGFILQYVPVAWCRLTRGALLRRLAVHTCVVKQSIVRRTGQLIITPESGSKFSCHDMPVSHVSEATICLADAACKQP